MEEQPPITLTSLNEAQLKIAQNVIKAIQNRAAEFTRGLNAEKA